MRLPGAWAITPLEAVVKSAIANAVDRTLGAVKDKMRRRDRAKAGTAWFDPCGRAATPLGWPGKNLQTTI